MTTTSTADLRYLKAAWYVSQQGGRATVSAVAERLEVSSASASAGLQRLISHGLLDRDAGRELTLTSTGEREALRLVRRHRLVETFLAEALGLPWDALHDEAEALEWQVSPRLEERIAEVLGHPRRDPHGDPIPSADGAHEEAVDVALASLTPGSSGTVSRVADVPELLRYLAGEGLVIGTVVTVERHAPFGGPLWLASPGGRHALGREATRAISVTDVQPPNED